MIRNKLLLSVGLLLLTGTLLQAQQLPLLKVSADKHYLVTEKGKPFFWLGDTAWELLHRLNREETSLYLKDRADKGFTVIQAVALAELDGLNTPNAYGEKPLKNNDPTQPNEAYFKHVDYVVKEAEKQGLYIGLLPTWGDKFNKAWGVGPEVFTPANAESFGEYLGKRYKKQNNIVWILGGDRWPEDEEDNQIIRAMARGIAKADDKHLITYHPSGGKSATDYFPKDAWLDLDMFQTGHDRDTKDYAFVQNNRQKEPTRPVINGEPRYEDHPNQFKPLEKGWMDDTDVRQSAYWTMLTGAAGYTYGSHDIWQMWDINRDPINGARTVWPEAIHLPGSRQAGYMKKLLEAFPWQQMKNDQSVILNDNPEDQGHMVGAISDKKDFMMIYTPLGQPIKADLSRLSGKKAQAFWFNPRDGRSKKIGVFDTTEKPEFKPWSVGRGSDFVLVVANEGASYQLP
ncbi:collagenase-like protein with putative collagen-binding domain [Pontibacter ummariensis]|uniref:Putative collagen-binding domain of a collagenase n=1 Tax=Pontibacter ummariensis TaxID=1610492 RepID=A0A239GZ45_9BACT|nr:glycoside hydrolase family 140 protein [Pontibacter ummariensis]PRY10956.1 collagenase-like protein with putative collagen-binding domain [Pontibacter ummariensis]SNS74410.1 Putative collagen-binding domain of a collagenase [Pontibacter ummariensis]